MLNKSQQQKATSRVMPSFLNADLWPFSSNLLWNASIIMVREIMGNKSARGLGLMLKRSSTETVIVKLSTTKRRTRLKLGHFVKIQFD